MTDVADLLGDWEPGSAPWHAARLSGLGGSEIAAVMGLSAFESRFALWHRKAGLIGPVPDSPDMEWGRRIERVIAEKFAEEHPELTVQRTGLWRNRQRPYQLGQPDLDCGVDLCEVKRARFDEFWGEPGTDEIPVGYRCQIQWYMDCLQRPRCHVAVLVGQSDYREYVVEYDKADALAMRERAVEFLATIERDERPPIDGSSATYQAIRELHPDIDPTDVKLPNDLAVAYLTAIREAAAAAEEKQRQTALVADAMGSAHRAMWDKECIATRRAKNGGIPYVQAVTYAAQRLGKTA